MTDENLEFVNIGTPKIGAGATAGFIAGGLAIAYGMFASNDGGGVDKAQLDELKNEIAKLAREFGKLKEQIYSDLDDLVLLGLSSRVFGVSEALSIYENLNDEIVAKGAFSDSVSNVVSLEAILLNRPSYLTDETFLKLEALHHVSLAFYVQLSILIGAKNFTDEAISKHFGQLSKITHEGNEAAIRIAKETYQMCGGGLEIEYEEPDKFLTYWEFIGYRKKGDLTCKAQQIGSNSRKDFDEKAAKYRAEILEKVNNLNAVSLEEANKSRAAIKKLVERLEEG